TSSSTFAGATVVSDTGGRLDRPDDVHVARAAADVPLDRPADVRFRRLRRVGEEVRRAEQHPRRAVAALEAVLVRERSLERRQLPVRGEAFDGDDLRPVGLDGEEHAALHRASVHQDRAGAAVAGVAADVGAGQVEVVANEVDEQLARLDLALIALAVDSDRDRVLAHTASRTARAASTSARWRR